MGVFFKTQVRSIVSLDRFQLAEGSARTSIWFGIAFNGLVSWLATIKAQVVLHTVLTFFFCEPSLSLFLFKGRTMSLGGIDLGIRGFSGQFSDTRALSTAWGLGGGTSIHTPVAIEFPGLLD